MHPAISINTLCLPFAPLGALADRVARIGARGISPDLEQILAFGVRESAQTMGDAGLEVATLTHRAFAYATPSEAEAGRERLSRTIDIAGEIGARTITMTTGGRGALSWPQAAERFAEAMAPYAEAARAVGIRLGIEPTSHLYADASLAHRLADPTTLARRAGIDVTIDLFACWVDTDIDTAMADAAPLTALVQVSDYVYGDRGLPCRAVPGDGAVPLDRLIPAIIRAGFTGWFDLEIIGPRLQAEGEDTGLRRAADFIGKLLETA
ncbi:sugar phosphate isomerase/epimerase [Novosphingobium sp. G106]|uniref:sugar phosphate isomerase/epimerase family protein n=1 Tax=Novosphingobium sp. G106 TaxID=2849500 RepID=UPI001C2D0ECF|nr:sugar phosphate isomerase/epimerase family protein [Novosphingobium sp. G106]MBV1686157.1 sugar phosphate isomerase/epimerase [Novosphingobium sp. G106]